MIANVESARIASRVVGGVHFGHYANCVILVWSAQFGNAEIHAVNDFTAKVAEASPDGIVIMALVEAGTPVPTSEGRRALEAYFARFADRTRAVVHVAEGKGLWASMARSVMTALQLLRKRSSPTKVVGESPEAIEWLAPFVVPQADAAGVDAYTGLTQYLASLRSATDRG